MKEIRVREIIGSKAVATDAIIIKELIKELIKEPLSKDESIKIDFNEVSGIDCLFLSTLFTNLICNLGRKFIINHIEAINLKDYDNYNRVVYGSAICMK